MVGEGWFAQRGWAPFPFQRDVWAAMAEGRSGLLHASTGSGKTYAVWFGALARAAAIGVPLQGVHPGRRAGPPQARPDPLGGSIAVPGERGVVSPPLGVLWLTPMRALAADTARALQAPLTDLGSGWTLGART
ncbi:MAG: DEAD/DEAH box helicase, partial [Rhizobiales bacterium]|nr:DEAD/DEAH box helicase [Rhizobacter sp.]